MTSLGKDYVYETKTSFLIIFKRHLLPKNSSCGSTRDGQSYIGDLNFSKWKERSYLCSYFGVISSTSITVKVSCQKADEIALAIPAPETEWW